MASSASPGGAGSLPIIPTDSDDRIRFFCYFCFHPVNAPAEFVGRPGKCHNCGKKTRIPERSTRAKSESRAQINQGSLPLTAPSVEIPAGKAPALALGSPPATNGVVKIWCASVRCPACSANALIVDRDRGRATLTCGRCSESFANPHFIDARVSSEVVNRAPVAELTDSVLPTPHPRQEVVGVVDDSKARDWKTIFAGKAGEAEDLDGADDSAGGLPAVI